MSTARIKRRGGLVDPTRTTSEDAFAKRLQVVRAERDALCAEEQQLVIGLNRLRQQSACVTDGCADVPSAEPSQDAQGTASSWLRSVTSTRASDGPEGGAPPRAPMGRPAAPADDLDPIHPVDSYQSPT